MGNPFATPDPDRDKNEPATAEEDRPRKQLPLEDDPRSGRSGQGSTRLGGPRKPMTPAAARSSMVYLGVLMVAILTSSMAFPWNVVGTIAAVAAIILGIRNLIRSRNPKYEGSSRFMTAVTLAMAAFALLTGVSSLALIGPQIEAQKCMGEAITNSAQRSCQAEYDRAREELIDRLKSATESK